MEVSASSSAPPNSGIISSTTCSSFSNTDINAIIGNDKDYAFEDSESFEKHGFTKQEFNAENEELVNVEEPDNADEEFDDAEEFFDDAEEVLDDEE